MNQTIKELIRFNIKSALKIRYYEKLNKEKVTEPEIEIRKHIVDDYKDIIINKLETIWVITAYSIYSFLKVKKEYKESHELIKIL